MNKIESRKDSIRVHSIIVSVGGRHNKYGIRIDNTKASEAQL